MGSYPALAVRPPENPVDSLQKAASLSDLLQNAPIRRQLMQQQAQSGQLGIQQQQLDLQSQQAIQKAYTESQGDPDKTVKLAAKYGAKPHDLMALNSAFMDQKMKTLDLVQKQGSEAARQANLMQGAHDAVAKLSPQERPAAYKQQLIGLQQQGVDTSQAPQDYPGDDAFKVMGAAVQGHTQQVESALKEAEAGKNRAQAARDQAEADKVNSEAAWFKSQGLPPGVSPEMAGYAAFLQKGGKPEGWTAYKSQQEAAATQPFKIQTAKVEAQTRMLMEGMAQPVYAYNPKSDSTALMSKTEALQAGMKAIRPVTAKEVQEDTMLNNRLGDVYQKIAEYEKSLQKPISAKDQGNMAALLGTHGIKIGAFGTEMPMDRINAALNQENLAGLSQNAREQLVAYRNAREAMTGYTRVLTGSGRSSDKNLELQEQTLPDPSITDPNFSQMALGAFKQNLRIVGQGLPELPGIKTPRQVEAEVWGN
jgi:hypothetical protein